MSKYIDVEIAKECFDPSDVDGDCFDNYDNVIRILNTVQAENVKPIVYGKWMFREITETIEKGVMECKCSVCGFEENTFNGGLIPFFLRDCNYCPNCGAQMEGGNNNDIS